MKAKKKIAAALALVTAMSTISGIFAAEQYNCNENEKISNFNAANNFDTNEELPDVDIITLSDEEESGKCGTDLNYILSSDGVLTISGTGSMSRTFAFNSKIRSVVIEAKITDLMWSSFYGCVNITDVVLPDTLKNIGEQAFYNCSSLKNIYIPYGTEKIGSSAFSRCENLENINLPNSIKEIGSAAFYKCVSLKGIYIPDKIEKIENNTFEECANLINVRLPKNLKSIGSNVFENCKNLKAIEIPSTVTEIGSAAFIKCSSLENITIPDGVKNIDKYAFSHCTMLENVEIKGETESIGDRSFEYCDSLKKLILPNSISSLGDSVFIGCTNLFEINIPENIKSIGTNTFCDCKNLKSLSVPEGVTLINNNALLNCFALERIYLPKSLTNIGDFVFNSCKDLKKIYYGGSKEDFDKIKVGTYNEMLYKTNVEYLSSGNKILSYNSIITDSHYFAVGDKLNGVYFNIQPIDAITSDESVEIEISSAKFDEVMPKYTIYSEKLDKTFDYSELIEYANSNPQEELYGKNGLFAKSSELPYFAERLSDNKIRVKLFPISSEYSGKENVNCAIMSFKIPINATAVSEGELTAKAASTGTNTENGEYPIGHSLAYRCGDVNADGILNAADYSDLLEYIRNKDYALQISEKCDNYKKYIDIDKDGIVTASDAALILKNLK